jgi:hypothetical protein
MLKKSVIILCLITFSCSTIKIDDCNSMKKKNGLYYLVTKKKCKEKSNEESAKYIRDSIQKSKVN